MFKNKVVWIIIAIVAILFFWVKGVYNNMVTQDEGVKTAWSQVENQYQRRMDLIPNLVNTVKGYAAHEKETLEGVVNARAEATKTTIDPSNLTEESLKKFQSAQGELIHKQTFNWTDIFLNQDHLSRQLSLHCVNLAQGFKEPVVYYQQNQDPKQICAVKKAVKDIHNTIGLPTGLWGGDELLRFGEPTTGSELCTAVEMMFSLEEMLEITGDVQWADYLERVAYNALPTQVTDDYSARQYYQQTNQVAVTREWRNFSTPHDDTDILFGELTGYPCCTSNLHQGWPKLVQNLWYATADNGIAALVYAPSSVKAKVANGVTVQVEEETAYPFDETLHFKFAFEDKK